MRRFFQNTKGAVTVFVTLLLIPAMLVSGTAVDLARIHTAYSIIQDANQMAANSVLTQYNALLYDIYGVMGVAKDDPIMAELLDSYIKVTVFGEGQADKELGSLQLFYGSDISMEEPLFPDGKNLRNEDVLRRQIEEYMKFRGPVLIVQKFLEVFKGNKIKEDTKVIEDKLNIESAISDIYEKYKELYDAINAADKCNQAIDGIAGGSFGAVSSALTSIREQFVDLKSCYSSWEKLDAADETEREKKNDYELKYKAILNNIKSLTIGGSKGSNWKNGKWGTTESPQGLNTTIENAKLQADNFKPKFDAVVNLSGEIDGMRNKLSQKVDELERKLDAHECSDEMISALRDKQGNPPKSVIERYRDILKWDNLTAMSNTFKNGGYRFIDNDVKPMLDDVKYRNVNNLSAGSLTRAELAQLPSDSRFRLSQSVSASRSKAADLAAFPSDSVTYKMPSGFLKFSEHSDLNRTFFSELTAMMNQPKSPPVKLYEEQNDEDGADSKEKQENIIEAVLKLVETAYIGLTNSPLGAKQINDNNTPEPEKLGILDIVTLIPKAMSEPFVEVISDPQASLAKAGDYILLLTYGTSVFSNYTTTRPDSIGKTLEELEEDDFPKSITGVPISPKVNYFFQSEWEYLYNGSNNAGANLSAITRLLFLVRLICNYVRVFSVSEITTIVDSIRTAFAWSPPLGIVLSELARAAFVAAESLVDVAALRSGHKVPLLKNVAEGEWICSPKGVIKAIKDTAADIHKDKEDKKKEKGLTYSNYMLLFLLAKGIVHIGSEVDAAKGIVHIGSEAVAATELAKRTGNLIEWNIINYKNEINSDEGKMTEALSRDGRFELVNMKTDFSITTSVNMKMLFLSMAFARNFSDTRGIGMPATIPITVTDYRGY